MAAEYHNEETLWRKPPKPSISPLILKELNGEPGGARTRDHRIKSAMLYQLSYRPSTYGGTQQ